MDILITAAFIMIVGTIIRQQKLERRMLEIVIQHREDKTKLYKFSADKHKEQTRATQSLQRETNKVLKEIQEIIYGEKFQDLGATENGLREQVKVLQEHKDEMEKFENILRANLPQNFFDFTKKTRGWKAAWKINQSKKKR